MEVWLGEFLNVNTLYEVSWALVNDERLVEPS